LFQVLNVRFQLARGQVKGIGYVSMHLQNFFFQGRICPTQVNAGFFATGKLSLQRYIHGEHMIVIKSLCSYSSIKIGMLLLDPRQSVDAEG
jgi:hypothetical protein